jgi:hypothetical protein
MQPFPLSRLRERDSLSVSKGRERELGFDKLGRFWKFLALSLAFGLSLSRKRARGNSHRSFIHQFSLKPACPKIQ